MLESIMGVIVIAGIVYTIIDMIISGISYYYQYKELKKKEMECENQSTT